MKHIKFDKEIIYKEIHNPRNKNISYLCFKPEKLLEINILTRNIYRYNSFNLTGNRKYINVVWCEFWS